MTKKNIHVEFEPDYSRDFSCDDYGFTGKWLQIFFDNGVSFYNIDKIIAFHVEPQGDNNGV